MYTYVCFGWQYNILRVWELIIKQVFNASIVFLEFTTGDISQNILHGYICLIIAYKI